MSVDAGGGAKGATEKVRSFVTFLRLMASLKAFLAQFIFSNSLSLSVLPIHLLILTLVALMALLGDCPPNCLQL